MPTQLTRAQWEQLDDQMSRTPSETDPDGVPGEHTLAPSARAGVHLIALLSKFGFNPISKQEAHRLAEQLLEAGRGRIILCKGVRKESVLPSNEERRINYMKSESNLCSVVSEEHPWENK